MEAPICDADLRREALCSACQKALDGGRITELDVKVSRVLYGLSKKFYFVNAEFVKALDLGDTVVLLCKGNIGSLIGRKGRVVAELNKELGKNVRIIEKVADEKKMIQDFVGKARVLAVNKVFRPEGREHKIVIARQDMERLPASPKVIKAGIEQMLGTHAEVGFG